jgi:ubiquinone/menaquinone biosynthesis C-methylase UbiE
MEDFSDIADARKFAKAHKKYAGLMYRSTLKDIGALGISGSCLEMGAGTGLLTTMIARENPDTSITAVDLSAGMAAVAAETIAENKMENRIRYLVGDVADEKMMRELGKFNLVYSAYSLHHWEEPEKAIRNLWGAVADSGFLYIFDFKRIGWICSLPLEGGEIKSMRRALTRDKIRAVFKDIGITDYKIKTVFPYLFQTITARKG